MLRSDPKQAEGAALPADVHPEAGAAPAVGSASSPSPARGAAPRSHPGAALRAKTKYNTFIEREESLEEIIAQAGLGPRPPSGGRAVAPRDTATAAAALGGPLPAELAGAAPAPAPAAAAAGALPCLQHGASPPRALLPLAQVPVPQRPPPGPGRPHR